MRPMLRPALIGLAAALLLSAGGTWLLLRPALPPEALPVPPDPPRLVEGPEYDRCLALLERDPQAAGAFAEAWEAEGGGEGARQCGALALVGLGEPDRAATRLLTIAAQSSAGPAARAAVLGQAAQAWLVAGEPARAHAAAAQGLALTPDDPELLAERARAAALLGRHGAALEDLDRLLALDPGRAEALVMRAAALRGIDRIERAAEEVERALLLDPDNAEALLERGIIRQLRGDSAGARADWERAVELAPDTATADLALQNLALNAAGPLRR